MSPAADKLITTDTVICIGGPLDSQGFTLAEWRDRQARGGTAALYEPGGEVPKRVASLFLAGAIQGFSWPEGAVRSATVLEPDLGDVTAVLGSPCPLCGWRRAAHRPEILVGTDVVPACPSWTPPPAPAEPEPAEVTG